MCEKGKVNCSLGEVSFPQIKIGFPVRLKISNLVLIGYEVKTLILETFFIRAACVLTNC